MAAARDRTAAAVVADDLACGLRFGLMIRPCGAPVAPFEPAGGRRVLAARDRLFPAPLLTLIVVIEERAIGTHDLAAMVAIGLGAMFADQGTNPRRLQLDGVERIETRGLGIQFGPGMTVEL